MHSILPTHSSWTLIQPVILNSIQKGPETRRQGIGEMCVGTETLKKQRQSQDSCHTDSIWWPGSEQYCHWNEQVIGEKEYHFKSSHSIFYIHTKHPGHRPQWCVWLCVCLPCPFTSREDKGKRNLKGMSNLLILEYDVVIYKVQI